MRDWSYYRYDPVERVYSAALAGDPAALLAIEMMPDRAETPAVTKSRKRKKGGAAPPGEVYRNLDWYEQVAALRQSQDARILSAARDVTKAARALAASGYSETQFLTDLQRSGQYQGFSLRPGREREQP
jgi:hypothetical protein